MKIITDITHPVIVKDPVVTVGTFDGLHIGHQAILRKVLEQAELVGGDSVVVTFNPHPRIVLGQDVALLNSQEEKREIISSFGITHLVEIPFTIEFSDLQADQFIKLINYLLKPSKIVIGYDHGFGRNRSGDIELLSRLGKEYGFEVLNVEPVSSASHRVSSTNIRNLLLDGHVAEAAELLGQPYSLSGKVIRGNQIGKRIGYPTANLLFDESNKLIPATGVYASYVIYNGQKYRGMTNIGFRPTISAHQLTVETNIFEFDRDIYYERIRIQLIDRIRDEKKFGNLNILKEQLALDRQATLKILT